LSDEAGERRVRTLLAVGFLLVILLLLADAFFGFHSIRSIETSASEMADDQFTQMALVDEVQREQGSLSAIFYRLAGDPDSLDRSTILNQIETTEQSMRRTVRKAPDSPETETWNTLVTASSAFAEEARRLLAQDHPPTLQSRELLRRHDEVLNTVSTLIRLTHAKSRNAKDRIETLAAGQLRKDLLLLGGSVLLAFICALLVMRTSTRLYKKIAGQSEQLTRISWQLLDNQEMVARRLSHELHDELGQALTALKTTITRHATSGCTDAEWIEASSNLLKESIHSTHEISQLLRPTILDDFGLESALNWLCERFEQTSGISIQYSSDFNGRLAAETETHLFRIAQEALTNAARHSSATLVTVRLHRDEGLVSLSIIDNGKGLPAPEDIRKGAFGLMGMQARAQSSHGKLTIQSRPGEGTAIKVSVSCVAEGQEEVGGHEAENPHLVS
jgi:signal transduction histidine kinase